VSHTPTRDPAAVASLQFLEPLLAGYAPRDIAVRCWDGSEWRPLPGPEPRCTIILSHSGALRRMFWPPKMLTLCEAYMHGDIDIEGDVEAFWALCRHLFMGGLPAGTLERKRLARQLDALPDPGPRPERLAPRLHGEAQSPQRDQQAITAHYDVSNDFYSLWLDSRNVYSCAYFDRPDVDLESAQTAKLNYICRKLRLRRGDRLLDIGCGWGGLACHAAAHFGAEVLGVTISHAQAEGARERIRKAGLAGRCRVEVRDYRELEGNDRFDKIVSVGMFEHVGEAMMPTYFRRAWELLRPGGVFLNHAISLRAADPLPVGLPFVYMYIFPDSQLEPVSTTLRAAEQTGFEVRDVESLREHYTLTVRHWGRRLEARADEARRLTSDYTYRLYRLYLAQAAYGFTIGQPNIYQSLLVKPEEGRSGMPLTRADWYAPAQEAMRAAPAA
jgi:cyclopropane-fatty-acyl-phospholipid synthase